MAPDMLSFETGAHVWALDEEIGPCAVYKINKRRMKVTQIAHFRSRIAARMYMLIQFMQNQHTDQVSMYWTLLVLNGHFRVTHPDALYIRSNV